MFTAVLFIIAKLWKQPKYPPTAKQYYSAIKKNNEILPFAVMWMNLENCMLSEINQREKQILYAITYMWTLKKNTNKWIKQN